MKFSQRKLKIKKKKEVSRSLGALIPQSDISVHNYT